MPCLFIQNEFLGRVLNYKRSFHRSVPNKRCGTKRAKPPDPRALINLFRGQSRHPALINCLWLLLKNLYPVCRSDPQRHIKSDDNSTPGGKVIAAGNGLGNPCYWSSRENAYSLIHIEIIIR